MLLNISDKRSAETSQRSVCTYYGRLWRASSPLHAAHFITFCNATHLHCIQEFSARFDPNYYTI